MSEWPRSPCDLDAWVAAALHPLAQPPQKPLPVPAELLDLIPPASRLRRAAVLVGLVDRGQGTQVILTRRTEGLSNHPGQVAFPGGRFDPADASLLDTALREAKEEIALARQHVRPLGYIDPLPTFTGFLVLPVVARVAAAHVSMPDPHEVAEVFEVPLRFLMDPSSVAIERSQLAGRSRPTWSFEFGGQRIWGATAAMLVNLRERLSESTAIHHRAP